MCIKLNTRILTTEAILVLAACFLRQRCRDVTSGADRHLDIIFGLQVVESSSLVSVLFREAFSHSYISFFHLLVNGFLLLVSILFSLTLYLLLIGGRYRWAGRNYNGIS